MSTRLTRRNVGYGLIYATRNVLTLFFLLVLIITESVIDAAALWSAGLRNMIPIYGTTGLTQEIVEHLRECRIKRAVLMMDSDKAGRAASVEIAAKLREASILVLTLISCGCPPDKPQPTRPEVVAGWKMHDEDGVRIVGEFLLRAGESTDNGVVGLTVAAISPPKPCAHEGWYAYPNAKIIIYRPADRTVLCEKTWIPGSLVLGADCEEVGFSALSIQINSTEGWVHIRLRQ